MSDQDINIGGRKPCGCEPDTRCDCNAENSQPNSPPLPQSSCSALLAGWTDKECRQLLEELLFEEKNRCCKIKLLTPEVSGPCDASISRYADHEQQRFSSSSVALAWLESHWAMYVQGMKPANDAAKRQPGNDLSPQ